MFDWTCISDVTSQNILDARDIAQAVKELTDLLEDQDDGDGAVYPKGCEERELLAALEEAESDIGHCETLIRDSYFKEYAQDFAEDIGAIQHTLSWPHDCIDWDQAADELQSDYTSVDIGGVTYWAR
jgi:hypothetical protein